MSQAVGISYGQEVEPLLPPHGVQVSDHTTSYRASTATPHTNHQEGVRPNADRLQHHHAMVQDRFSLNWWIEWIIILVVFSVTGSSTMLIVKPLMKALGLTGTWRAGPWSFRIAYIVLTLPLYSCMLLFISTLVCRRPYFMNLLIKMWSRLLPKFITARCTRRLEES